jgi:Arc/MetJ-type ribon-helix-helix transcriptional regulator
MNPAGCIPIWYAICMTKQITVRLPDDLVRFLDAEVTSEAAPNRTTVVARALENERRRRLAERDAAIYRQGDDADLAAFTEWAARQPTDID